MSSDLNSSEQDVGGLHQHAGNIGQFITSINDISEQNNKILCASH